MSAAVAQCGLTNKLDCDREASHNLNRLLDKPGPECLRSLIENIFFGNCSGLKFHRNGGRLIACFRGAVATDDARLGHGITYFAR